MAETVNESAKETAPLLAYLALIEDLMAEIYGDDEARRCLSGPLEKLIRQMGRQIDGGRK